MVIALSFIDILIWKLAENGRWLNPVAGLITANSSAIFHVYIIVTIMKKTVLSSFLFFLFLSFTIQTIDIALSLVEEKSLRVQLVLCIFIHIAIVIIVIIFVAESIAVLSIITEVSLSVAYENLVMFAQASS